MLCPFRAPLKCPGEDCPRSRAEIPWPASFEIPPMVAARQLHCYVVTDRQPGIPGCKMPTWDACSPTDQLPATIDSRHRHGMRQCPLAARIRHNPGLSFGHFGTSRSVLPCPLKKQRPFTNWLELIACRLAGGFHPYSLMTRQQCTNPRSCYPGSTPA